MLDMYYIIRNHPNNIDLAFNFANAPSPPGEDFIQTENIPTFQQTEKHRLAHNSQMGSLVPLIQWYKLRRIRGILTERLTLELQNLSESRARPSEALVSINWGV